MKISEKAPMFSLQNKEGRTVSLNDFSGKWVVLYFYPKDNTPGCTAEAVEFSATHDQFLDNNSIVIGISTDSVSSHLKFSEKYQLQIELLSDPDHTVCELYGVWQKKKFIGKEYMGISRTTFLINPEGIIEHVWENVKVSGHAKIVETKVCSLK